MVSWLIVLEFIWIEHLKLCAIIFSHHPQSPRFYQPFRCESNKVLYFNFLLISMGCWHSCRARKYTVCLLVGYFEQYPKRLILDLAFDHAVFLDGPLAPMTHTPDGSRQNLQDAQDFRLDSSQTYTPGLFGGFYLDQLMLKYL
ncbi:hypothetical protein [Pseudomonas syringae]|nr:hypothetical protein [Pseudomonas syringae]